MRNKRNILAVAAGCIFLGLVLAAVGYCIGGREALTVDLMHGMEETFTERLERFSGQIDDIEISAVSDDVILLPSEDGDCYVQVFESSVRKWKISLKAGKLSVLQEPERRVGVFLNSPEHHAVSVYLPERVYRSLEIGTVSGEIRAEDFSFSDTDLSTTSGNVKLRGSFGKLEVGTVSGELHLEDCEAGETDLSSTSGKMYLRGSFGEAELGTVSGDIRLDGYEAAETEISSTSGSVSGTVSVPMRIRVDTLSGTVDCDSVASATNEMEIGTTSGDVELRFR